MVDSKVPRVFSLYKTLISTKHRASHCEHLDSRRRFLLAMPPLAAECVATARTRPRLLLRASYGPGAHELTAATVVVSHPN